VLEPTALNEPLPNPIPVAVVAVKEPGTSKLALLPNIMPDGFIRNKLGLLPPLTRIKPLIIEGSPPFMRVKMFSILEFVTLNSAISFGDKPNRVKLWKRFLSEVLPPPILKVPVWPAGVLTVVPVPVGFGSGTML
jgi:hypothetical protein